MAEPFSVERRKLMRFLGAKVIVTPASERAVGMINKTIELAKTHGWFMTRQFENEANPDYHSRTTAREILDDFAGERLDYWVTGYGTGGTLKGVARVLAKERPETKIIVCQPEDAQLLGSGIEQERNADGTPSAPHPNFKPHPMQGWTPDFIPKLTDDAVAMKVIRSGSNAVCQGACYQGGYFCRHHFGRNTGGRAQGCSRSGEGSKHSLYASRHRGALFKYAAFCRHIG
jgi:cysteine synthase